MVATNMSEVVTRNNGGDYPTVTIHTNVTVCRMGFITGVDQRGLQAAIEHAVERFVAVGSKEVA